MCVSLLSVFRYVVKCRRQCFKHFFLMLETFFTDKGWLVCCTGCNEVEEQATCLKAFGGLHIPHLS